MKNISSIIVKKKGFDVSRQAFFIREKDEQLHTIGLQASSSGTEYFINLGFQSSFIPNYLQCQLGNKDHEFKFTYPAEFIFSARIDRFNKARKRFF